MCARVNCSFGVTCAPRCDGPEAFDLNAYSRPIVGWSMSDTMQANIVSDALLIALWRRGKPSSLVHHSDQGSQD